MDMPPLGHASAIDGILGQYVPLDDRDRVIEVGEDAGGQQARHAPAENQCVIAEFLHRNP